MEDCTRPFHRSEGEGRPESAQEVHQKDGTQEKAVEEEMGGQVKKLSHPYMTSRF